MEPRSTEQRELKRIRVQFPVGIVGDLLDGKGELLNLSTGGCRVRGDQRLQVTPYLRLLLYPQGDTAPIKVELAVVRWVCGNEFGLQFIRMHTDHQKRLRNLLQILGMMPGHEDSPRLTASAIHPA